MNRSTVVIVVAIAMCFAFTAEAAKGDPAVLMSAMEDGSNPAETDGRSTPDSQLVFDISNTASWDALDSANNVTLVVPLGVGAIMTGIGWDVNITTVGGSYLNEAVMYFDGEDLDGSGLFLTCGSADAAPGTGAYFSAPVDLSDNAIPDIPIGADGNLYIQFYESYDDLADAIDADFTLPSSLTIDYIAGAQPPTPTADPGAGGNPIPTMNRYGIIAMVVALFGIALLVISRRK